MKEAIKKLCKLYKGEQRNPYNNIAPTDKASALMYLRFQIWDAERAVTENFQWWKELWENKGLKVPDGEDLPTALYKLAVTDKLNKMSSEQYDYVDLFNEI